MIGSRSIETASACAAGFGAPAFGTYEDVLANPDIEAVYVSLPNSLHSEWTIKAAEAGKHVWCEKPAALTLESARHMVKRAAENNVRLMEGFMFLYHPQHALVRDLINDGAIGELQSFNGTFSLPMPDPGNIRLDVALGGGVLNDAGIYPIRASRMIFADEPESVSCNLTIDESIGVDVEARLELIYPGGRTASISSAFTDDYQSTYEIVGTKGILRMERAYAVPEDRTVKIFLQVGTEEQQIEIPPANHFKLMVDAFCKEIMLGDESRKTYEDDILAQARILEAGRISDSEKRSVGLSEVS